MDIPFNINDSVKVKYTSFGLEIHRQLHDRLSKLVEGHGSKIPPYAPPKTDKDGWSTIQLWELMHIFGSEVGIGGKLPFSGNILVVVPNVAGILPKVDPPLPG